ncbi:hypothetical protein [Tautonia plasticadhaerens]|uniref:Uncharacterized protein n=1 Tax=Tautonia plasticadhaerens TaxID=2527974 RepID=A0A518HEP8_9BACT|nr:hypothetical protein [Tautonia plasticadhaerens]QDV39314.1 hypothetical protein ElP_72780 [Tautonia plasticadhaerens]
MDDVFDVAGEGIAGGPVPRRAGAARKTIILMPDDPNCAFPRLKRYAFTVDDELQIQFEACIINGDSLACIFGHIADPLDEVLIPALRDIVGYLQHGGVEISRDVAGQIERSLRGFLDDLLHLPDRVAEGRAMTTRQQQDAAQEIGEWAMGQLQDDLAEQLAEWSCDQSLK